MRNEQGVIVSLILFIVLTLVFGVTTYMGAKSYGEQKTKLAEKVGELSSAKSANFKLAGELKDFKEKLGYGFGSADEVVNGTNGQEKRGGSASDDEDSSSGSPVHYNGMKDDVLEALGEKGKDLTFRDAVAQLGTALDAQNRLISERAQLRDENLADARKSITDAVKNEKEFNDSVDRMTDEHSKQVSDKSEQYAELTNQFNEQTKEFDVVQRQAKTAIDKATDERDRERAIGENLAEINMDLSRRIDLLTNADFDVADATVISVDQVGKFVRLDVGQKDGVRPLTKFNVFPKDALIRGGVKAKASVQVTRALDDEVCEAKILSDDQNNPIQPGDLVFTPLWRPGEVYQYALDFRLFITNLADKRGVSDLDEIYRAIQLSGGEVVAYIDDDGVVHGKITPEVYRLIVSDEQIDDRIDALGDVSDEDKERIRRDHEEFVASAGENGVRTMRLSDLLVQLNYKKTDALQRNREALNDARKQSERIGTSVPVVVDSNEEPIPGGLLPVVPEGQEEPSADVGFRQRFPK